MKSIFSRFAPILVAGLVLAPLTCQAVPSFARQAGLQCIACHTEFPELNSFGRQFKLSGYTLATGDTNLPPIAFMLQPSFTNTQKGTPGGAAPGFNNNNNLAFTQVSVFYAGRLFGPYAANIFGKDGAAFANKFGIFSQTTYDGVNDVLHWDNTELRYSDTGTIKDTPVTFGFYLNNNPTLQDPWNTTPAWGFPFSSTGLPPPTVAAGSPPAPLIDGGLAQQVAGFGGYMFVDNSFYIDLAAYHTLSPQFQNDMGINPNDETQVTDLAPYWRFAYTKAVDNNSYEIGTFGLAADTFPGRDESAGRDHYLDLGFDAQAQFALEGQDITAMVSYIREQQSLGASQALGNSVNSSDNLGKFKATVDYLYDKTYGGAVQFFSVTGSEDTALYPNSATGSPNSDGEVLQLNWLPFNKGGGPSFWPKSNVKFSLQYVIYNRINGTSHNAWDNNTLYLEAWIAF